MAGLINVAGQYKQQAKQGLQRVADLEHAREQAGENIKAQKKQGMMTAVGMGAGVGAMMGMQAGSVGGPLGMAIGAGIGLLASSLF